MVSPSRRPSGQTGGPTTKSWLTWSLFLLSVTNIAAKPTTLEAHHAPIIASGSDPPQAWHRKSQPGRSPAEIPLLNHDLPTAKYHDTHNEVEVYKALAPAQQNSVVRAPSAQSTESSGLSPLSSARLLRDWEADDIILLATIDGALHARDRRTGRHRWTLEMPESPMIETLHSVQNDSYNDENFEHDQFVFIVEPSPEGHLYMQFANPSQGLTKSPVSVRKMVEKAPFYQNVNGRVLATTTSQTTRSYTLDAETGEILFPRPRSADKSPPQPRCLPRNGLDFEDGACKPVRTIRLGRISYTFSLVDEASQIDFATIKYNEWVVNNANTDLQLQHDSSLDGYDVRVFHNGRIMGLKMNNGRPQPAFNEFHDSPVARVFDVLRPRENGDDYADLVLLQRDISAISDTPIDMWHDQEAQKSRVFVNQTENGQWFCLSERSYPGVTHNAVNANIQSIYYAGGYLDLRGDMKDIVGVHDLARNAPVPQLEQAAMITEPEKELDYNINTLIAPGQNKSNTTDTYIVVLATMFTCFLGWLIWQQATKKMKGVQLSPQVTTIQPSIPQDVSTIQVENRPITPPVATVEAVATPTAVTAMPVDTDKALPSTPAHSRAGSGLSVTASPARSTKVATTTDEPQSEDDGSEDDENVQNADNDSASQPENKDRKKTKRGKRGGRGRNRKNKSIDIADFEPRPVVSVEKNLANNMIQVGRLVYDPRIDNCLGQGSSGTAVFPGTFDGRAVAVKRLVKSANSLAEKEIKHLVSSDENPHVIRYFGKEESIGFFYIALDRFETSLDQFVEYPEKYPSLVSQTNGYNVKDALRQVTRGLQHIHSLKLVHRDIKPQNILVRSVKSARPLAEGQLAPLLFVISDFGLCKPLEDGPDSVFAATRTAAGTTGWKAPELLVSSRDAIAAPSATASSTTSSHSYSKSTTTSSDGTVIDPPSGRRATKAIDIFSLGCVFFYVMTRGGHPFDVNSPLARDLNIKEGKFDTSALRQDFCEYDFDADDLILQMITHNPRQRPDTAGILAHPYFWSMDQKLEFLVAVSDAYEERKQKITNIHDENASRTDTELKYLDELAALQAIAPNVIGEHKDGSIKDFLRALPRSFLNEMGKQRKYTGTKMIDLLRVIRNKKNHFHDLPDDVKKMMTVKDKGVCMEGYYKFWRERFPSLLVNCHTLVHEEGLVEEFALGRWYDGSLAA